MDDRTRVLVMAAVLGIVAAAVVWYLERFESRRLHAEVRQYLSRYDEFRAWLARHGDGQAAP